MCHKSNLIRNKLLRIISKEVKENISSKKILALESNEVYTVQFKETFSSLSSDCDVIESVSTGSSIEIKPINKKSSGKVILYQICNSLKDLSKEKKKKSISKCESPMIFF